VSYMDPADPDRDYPFFETAEERRERIDGERRKADLMGAPPYGEWEYQRSFFYDWLEWYRKVCKPLDAWAELGRIQRRLDRTARKAIADRIAGRLALADALPALQDATAFYKNLTKLHGEPSWLHPRPERIDWAPSRPRRERWRPMTPPSGFEFNPGRWLVPIKETSPDIGAVVTKLYAADRTRLLAREPMHAALALDEGILAEPLRSRIKRASPGEEWIEALRFTLGVWLRVQPHRRWDAPAIVAFARRHSEGCGLPFPSTALLPAALERLAGPKLGKLTPARGGSELRSTDSVLDELRQLVAPRRRGRPSKNRSSAGPLRVGGRR
jgi:hypothetical protein